MNLPKVMLGIDKANNCADFTAFVVIELLPDKNNLSVNMVIKETLLKDFRFKPKEITDKLFEEEKERLMKKYNIPNENVVL